MWVKCKRNNTQGTLEHCDAGKKEIVNKTITNQPLVNASTQALREMVMIDCKIEKHAHCVIAEVGWTKY